MSSRKSQAAATSSEPDDAMTSSEARRESVGNAGSSSGSDADKTWELVNTTTGNTITSYDTREEAVDAAEWYRKTWNHELAVIGFDAKGEAVERV